MIWQIVATVIEVFHALAMVAWIVGIPLLFIRAMPRLRRAYALYAVGFVGLYQVSRLALDECFLTTLARLAWQRARDAGGDVSASNEWFTVRIAQALFELTPSHRSIVVLAQILVFVTAAGEIVALFRARAMRRATSGG